MNVKELRPVKAYTDYPIALLGDKPGVQAPMRECLVKSYDGNKYCLVEITGTEASAHIKSGYIYMEDCYGPDRGIIQLPFKILKTLNKKMRRVRGKPASKTIRYVVRESELTGGKRYATVNTKKQALSRCRHYGHGASVHRLIFTENRKGASRSFSDKSYSYWNGELISYEN